ncbi:MAG TPA: hypothetical protein VKP69_12110 [Isosphaeraceae bacterium]|nr:hypothetical protein [Isosphaeraceae bacterium]
MRIVEQKDPASAWNTHGAEGKVNRTPSQMSIITHTRPPVKPDREDIAPDHDLERMSYTQSDRDWAAVALNEHATDFDAIEDEELEWPGTREEYERWLDAIAPTEGELEHRARCDAFLGHCD